MSRSFFHQVNYSKFFPPKQHPLYFGRERLIEHLNTTKNHKYTLLQAPEGYGKSSLLSDWYHRVKQEKDTRRVIWFRVDSHDRDSTCFWSNLIEDLNESWSGIKKTALENMDILEQSSPFQLLLTLANYIVKFSDPELHYSLIFDDFESFKHSESEAQFFIFADMLPANVNVIIASKEYLNNKLIEQDAYTKFSVLDTQELAIAKNEIKELFALKNNLEISHEVVEQIYLKTEGWPLALYALLDTTRGGVPIEEALKELTAADHYLHDAVFQKAIQELPQKIVMFLLETSFFERFSASFCNYVFDSMEASAIIMHLERSGTFIFAVDSDHEWYRYHYLFAEWLKNQAMSLHRDQIRVLNHKAAYWYRNNNNKLLSAKHIVAASEGGFISALTRCVFTESDVKNDMIFPLLFSLREHDLEQDPFFCLLASWSSVFSGRPREAKKWLKLAEKHIREGHTDATGKRLRPPQKADLDSAAHQALVKRITLVTNVIYSKCQTLEGRAELGIEQSKPILFNNEFLLDDTLKMILYQNLGEAYELKGETENASKYYQKAMTIAQVNGYDFLVGFSRYQIIRLVYAQGRLSEAEKLSRTALAGCPPDFTVYGALYSILGLIEITENKFDELDILLRRAFGRVSPDRNIDIYLDACIARVQYLMVSNNYSEALLQMAVARQAIINNEDIPPRGTAPLVYAQQTRLYVRLKDFDSAEDTMAEFHALNLPLTAEGTLLRRMLENLIIVEKKQGTEETSRDLEALANEAAQGKYILYQIEIYLIITRLSYYTDKHSDAIKFLKKAIDLAKREQIIQLFLNEGEVIRLLLTELVGSRGLNYESDRFARRLVVAFDAANANLEKTKEKPSWLSENQRTENVPFADHWGLTNREGEVLQLLVRGMNRKEISAELCTSQNTVKTHISHIYEKMDVHSVSELLKKMMEHEAL